MYLMSRKESRRVYRTARQRRESVLKQNSKNSPRTSQGSAQQQRRRAKRRSPWLIIAIIGGILVGIVIVIGVYTYIAQHQPPAGVIGPTDPKVLGKVTNVEQSILTKVNTGGVQNILLRTDATHELTGPNGKPEIFYFGAESCPYCAVQRWSLVIALSRFGTFSKLPEIYSSNLDVYPNTSTFTFVKSQYSSPYIDFVPVEAEDRNHNPLQIPTPHEQLALGQYNVNGIPFLDIANRYVASHPFFDPAVLQHLSQKDIANRLSNPNDDVTKNIVGGANYLTAAICSVTHDQPANICTQGPIPAIEQSVIHDSSLWQSQTDVPDNNTLVLSGRRREDDPSASEVEVHW